jgi:DNA-binding transcriptional LysR family regulator
MDQLAALNAFAQVVRDGSFAGAARTLGQSRSQVNRLVIGLEDSLGVSLLTRTTRSLALTPVGKAFHARCEAILNDLAEAMREVQLDHEAPQGSLKLNAPMSFGTLLLGPALVEFMRRYPSIHVQLTLSDRFIDPLTDGFDITVRIAERVESPSLIDHDIVRIDRILCAAPSLLERNGNPRTLTELAAMPCLHYGDLPNGGRWRLTGPEGTIDLKVEGVLCSNNAEVLCQAAAEGMGVALLPTFIAAEEIRAGRLVPILKEFSAAKLFLRLIYPPNRHLSARIRVFVKFMQDRFGDDAQWTV